MINVDRSLWAEEGLGDADEMLARVVETSGDGLMIIAANGGITFLNPAAERLLGVSRTEAAGLLYTDQRLRLLTLDGNPVPKQDQPAARVLQTGEAVAEQEFMVERPDGGRLVLAITASPLPDAEGEITGVAVALRDATARQATEEALRHLAAQHRAQAELLDLAHDAVFVRDVATAVIRYWNRGAEEMYGYSREEALNMVSHDLLETQFPQPLGEIQAAMFREGQWEGELIHRTRDGRELTVESRWALQRDARGEPAAFLEISHDVTARKQAQAELAQRVEDLARASEEAARRHREVTAVNRSLGAISRSLDLNEVLQNIADAARELVEARYAALGVADSSGHITQFITSGITPEQREAIGPLPQGHGLLGALIAEAKPMRVRRIAEDPRSQGFPPHHPPMTNLLGAPIISRGRVLGDLYLTDKLNAEEFSAADEDLLLLLAGQAGVAIENGRLYEAARAARDQLRVWNRDLESQVAERTRQIEQMSREMTARVLQAQEEERGRIARELHDDAAQSLAKLLIDLDLIKPHLPEEGRAAQGLARMEAGLRRTLEEVRALSHDLRPAILEDFGLGAALHAYAEDWTQTFGIPVRVAVQTPPEPASEPTAPFRLPPNVEIALFRIAQEAMMNAGKYAQAQEVRITLSIAAGTVRLAIEDNGVGFDPEGLASPTRQSGLGLYGMRERAALLGGRLTIASHPGQGTRITLEAPLV